MTVEQATQYIDDMSRTGYGGVPEESRYEILLRDTPPEDLHARWDKERGGGFLNFLCDMGMAPSVRMALGRPDPTKPWGPGNCEWFEDKEMSAPIQPVATPKPVESDKPVEHARVVENHDIYSVRSREYALWRDMRYRCSNPAYQTYPNYGGRGIKVCEKWDQSFPAFINDMGRAPDGMRAIGRKDPDGDYTPENCIWVRSLRLGKARNTKVPMSVISRIAKFEHKRARIEEALVALSKQARELLEVIHESGWRDQLSQQALDTLELAAAPTTTPDVDWEPVHESTNES